MHLVLGNRTRARNEPTEPAIDIACKPASVRSLRKHSTDSQDSGQQRQLGDAKESDVEHRVRKKSVTRSHTRSHTHTHTRVTQCLYPECAHALVLDARLSLVVCKVDGASLYVTPTYTLEMEFP